MPLCVDMGVWRWPERCETDVHSIEKSIAIAILQRRPALYAKLF